MELPNEQKKCPKCETWKAREEFPPSKSTKDGLFGYCRDCSRKLRVERYHSNPSVERASQTIYFEANKEKILQQSADKYREKREEQVRLGLDYHSKKYTPDGKRICTGCKLPKELTDYASDPRYKDGLRSRCKECQNTYSKGYYWKDPETAGIKAKQYRVENPERHKEIRRNSHLKKEYGITQEEYLMMLDAQDNRCAICFCTFNMADSKLFPHIDHCHDSGKVRSILCQQCNLALGAIQDSDAIAMSMVKYLGQHIQTVLSA